MFLKKLKALFDRLSWPSFTVLPPTPTARRPGSFALICLMAASLKHTHTSAWWWLMPQHVPLSHAFPLRSPGALWPTPKACVVIICMCACSWVFVSRFALAPCVPPNWQLLQFGLGSGLCPVSISFPPVLCWAICPFVIVVILHGCKLLQVCCKYVCIYDWLCRRLSGNPYVCL